MVNPDTTAISVVKQPLTSEQQLLVTPYHLDPPVPGTRALAGNTVTPIESMTMMNPDSTPINVVK